MNGWLALEGCRVPIRHWFLRWRSVWHNGLKSVIAALGTDQFPRVRLGVGEPPHPDYDTADWVLGVPKGKDAELLADAVKRAAEAAECYVTEGPERAMSRYNRKA